MIAVQSLSKCIDERNNFLKQDLIGYKKYDAAHVNIDGAVNAEDTALIHCFADSWNVELK